MLSLTDKRLVFKVNKDSCDSLPYHRDNRINRKFVGAGSSRASSWLIKNKVESESVDFFKTQRSLSFYNVRPEDKYRHDPDRYKHEFVSYIERTSKQFLIFTSKDGEFSVPYKHRWEKSYRKGILAKLYQLQIWAHRHNLGCGMLSLTSAQTGYTDIEILEREAVSWGKLQDILAKMGFLTFMLYEPHESGIPHMHAMIFGDCCKENLDRLERLYVEKYGMNDGIVDKDGKQHAFEFSSGLKDNPQLESLVNYLMKYLSETVISDITNNESLVRFHSLFFHTHKHLWSASRYLSHVMGKTKLQRSGRGAPIDSITIDNTEIYNRAYSAAVACKYQTIKGVKYKYELLPFEIKPKYDRMYDAFLDNYAVRQWFSLWGDLVDLMESGHFYR